MTGEQDGPQRDEVGSLGDEAAKLLGALSQWARESPDLHAAAPAEERPRSDAADHPADPSGDHPGGPGSGAGGTSGPGLGEQLAAALRQVDQHVATGAAECRYCPVCRVVHAVRETSPEVREHLTSAAGSLLQAAAGLLATEVPKDRGAGAKDGDEGPGRVERIDLDGEEWPEDEGGR